MSAPNGQYRGEHQAAAQQPPAGYPHGPALPYHPAPPSSNGWGWDVTKATVPVLIFVAALMSSIYFAFHAGDLWRNHQTRLTSIENEIKDVKGELGEIKISLKELVSASASAKKPTPPASWPTAEVRRTN